MRKQHVIILSGLAVVIIMAIAVYLHIHSVITEEDEALDAINSEEAMQNAQESGGNNGPSQTNSGTKQKGSKDDSSDILDQKDKDAIKALRKLMEDRSLDGEDNEALLSLAQELARSERPAQQSYALDVLMRLGSVEAVKTCAELAEGRDQAVSDKAIDAFKYVLITYGDGDKKTVLPQIKHVLKKCTDDADIVSLLQSISSMKSHREILQIYGEVLTEAESTNNQKLASTVLTFARRECYGDERIKTAADIRHWIDVHLKE